MRAKVYTVGHTYQEGGRSWEGMLDAIPRIGETVFFAEDEGVGGHEVVNVYWLLDERLVEVLCKP